MTHSLTDTTRMERVGKFSEELAGLACHRLLGFELVWLISSGKWWFLCKMWPTMKMCGHSWFRRGTGLWRENFGENFKDMFVVCMSWGWSRRRNHEYGQSISRRPWLGLEVCKKNYSIFLICVPLSNAWKVIFPEPLWSVDLCESDHIT